MALVPLAIEELSDDDIFSSACAPPAEGVDRDEHASVIENRSAASSSSRPKRKAIEFEQAQISDHFRSLRNVTHRNCTCKIPECRRHFRDDPAKLDALLQLRLEIHQLPKLDADEKAAWLKCCKPPDSSARCLTLSFPKFLNFTNQFQDQALSENLRSSPC